MARTSSITFKEIDPKKATKEEIAAALELLAKDNHRKARVKAGEIKGGTKWADLTETQRQSLKSKEAQRRAKIKAELAAYHAAVAAGKIIAV